MTRHALTIKLARQQNLDTVKQINLDSRKTTTRESQVNGKLINRQTRQIGN